MTDGFVHLDYGKILSAGLEPGKMLGFDHLATTRGLIMKSKEKRQETKINRNLIPSRVFF